MLLTQEIIQNIAGEAIQLTRDLFEFQERPSSATLTNYKFEYDEGEVFLVSPEGSKELILKRYPNPGLYFDNLIKPLEALETQIDSVYNNSLDVFNHFQYDFTNKYSLKRAHVRSTIFSDSFSDVAIQRILAPFMMLHILAHVDDITSNIEKIKLRRSYIDHPDIQEHAASILSMGNEYFDKPITFIREASEILEKIEKIERKELWEQQSISSKFMMLFGKSPNLNLVRVYDLDPWVAQPFVEACKSNLHWSELEIDKPSYGTKNARNT